MKFSFNKDARKESISALKKLGSFGSPASLAFTFFLNNLTDKIAIAIGSAMVFIVCHILVVIIASMEADKTTPNDKEKVS